MKLVSVFLVSRNVTDLFDLKITLKAYLMGMGCADERES
jgi:hypothetical protein